MKMSVSKLLEKKSMEQESKAFVIHRDDPFLRDAIYDVLERYYLKGERSEAILDVDLKDKRRDVEVLNIDTRFDHPDCEDQDFVAFRKFNNPNDLILDIGANWGYSVIDMWANGTDCKIVSFEPVKFYAPLFDRIKELRPGRYDYKTLALFDQPSRLKFTLPVINKLPIYALSSANETPDLEVMVNNMIFHITNYMRDDELISVRLHEFESPVDTIDNCVTNGLTDLSWENIAAIKIDVEGLEFPVLRGARDTLKKYKPLIMLEGGNRWPGLDDYMEEIGYQFAEREGHELILTDGVGQKINGFFVHKDKFVEYRNAGILQ